MTTPLLLLGFLTGIFSGIFGLGGGIIVVPALVYLFHFSQHQAQGTSLAMLLPPIGILAVWRYWEAGHIQIVPALLLAAGFIIGALFGAHFAVSIPQLLMKRLFGGALLLIGSYMIVGK